MHDYFLRDPKDAQKLPDEFLHIRQIKKYQTETRKKNIPQNLALIWWHTICHKLQILSKFSLTREDDDLTTGSLTLRWDAWESILHFILDFISHAVPQYYSNFYFYAILTSVCFLSNNPLRIKLNMFLLIVLLFSFIILVYIASIYAWTIVHIIFHIIIL